MNIGIIVYSKTGNTLSVANAVKERLEKDGHNAKIEQVIPVSEPKNPNDKIEFQANPNPLRYDALIVASPVHAFSLAPVMKAYLSQTNGLKGKKINCFLTQHFPHAWMGGTHAKGQLEAACKAAGGTVLQKTIVNWSNKKRDELIQQTVEAMTRF